jgi:hypothetical protein
MFELMSGETAGLITAERGKHADSEVVGIHASRSVNRFEALEPVRQGVHRCFVTLTHDRQLRFIQLLVGMS